MSMTLYIARLPQEIQEAEIAALLEQYGPVTRVERLLNHATQQWREGMVAEMERAHAMAAIQALNGYQLLEDEPLFVTPYRPGEPFLNDDALKSYVGKVAARLQEQDSLPKRQIRAMSKLCGPDFIEALLNYAFVVQEQGGLMTQDESRNRTQGGVFFYLARQRMSNKMQKMIFFLPVQAEKKAREQPRQRDKGPRPQRAGQQGQRPQKTHSAGRNFLFGGGNSPTPAPPAPEEILPQELTPEIREEFEQLQVNLKAAQQELDSLRQQGAEKSGLFSATKEIWRIESRLKLLQKQFPELA